MTQVIDHRLADIRGQRQPIQPVALAPHRQLTGPPVDVVEPQCGHLSRAQTEAHQHGQDREIAPADRTAPVAAAQQRRDHRRVQGLGQRRQLRVRDSRDRRGEVARSDPGDEQEPQQRPQRAEQRLHRPHAAQPRLRQHERGHLRGREIVKVEPVTHGVSRQEPPSDVLMAAHRGRRQTPLDAQIAAIGIEQPIHRALHRRRLARRHPRDLAQVGQQRPQRPDRTPTAAPRASPRAKEPLHHR